MSECTHETQERFRVCTHLLAGEVPYVQRFSGRAMECELVCRPCLTTPGELRDVCATCRDAALEGGHDGIVGTPGIAEEPSRLRFDHSVHAALPHPLLVDARPVLGGDRDLWIGLSGEGELWRIDFDRREVRKLAVATGLLDPGPPAQRLVLHLSRDARLAAVVQQRGRLGSIIDLETGMQTIALTRDSYHEEHCDFSLAFVQRGGRDLVIHSPDWNRLDISDARTGELLTARGPTSYQNPEPRPEHYLDYFHCGLHVSPDQRTIIGNGWAWHPLGIVVAWSLERWLAENVWESEDGPTRKDLTWRDYFWDGPLCWIDNQRVAVWGYGESDPLTAAVQIFDASTAKRERWFGGPQGDLVFDRELIALDGERGASVWNIDRGTRLLIDPLPAPARYHPTAKTFISLGGPLLTTSRLCGHHAGEPWNTGVIAELAASIARDRTFEELPVLGDALEAAGCTERALLDHCQQPGEHGDRCWVLDRLQP